MSPSIGRERGGGTRGEQRLLVGYKGWGVPPWIFGERVGGPPSILTKTLERKESFVGIFGLQNDENGSKSHRHAFWSHFWLLLAVIGYFQDVFTISHYFFPVFAHNVYFFYLIRQLVKGWGPPRNFW
jgi:hypothetical protein